MRQCGCPVTILNTIDHLGKFDSKADEGFFVGYSLNSKAFRVFNSRTRIVEENLHIRFSESTPNAVGSRPNWLFDIDALTRTMNCEPIVAGTRSNGFADDDNVNSTNTVNAASTNKVNDVGGKTSIKLPFDPNMSALEDISIFDFLRDDDDDVGAEADMNNLDTTIQVSPIPTTRIHKDHPLMKNPKDSKAWYEPCQIYVGQWVSKEGKVTRPYSTKGKGDFYGQVYVDDIIFGSTKKDLCNAFEKLMNEKFQMSSIGELTFFLGLQVQ
ncbi:uncharacterized mitochondrial protein-like protein [Tanacetum coccineum]|uniref:Uncharacterized mitochondrial protein-like protein n=1 Tax=Tanacetum coccineum TaxID=301880 RepID=A0ABQ5J711_9ASTR